jgi:hypothetical protein
MVENRIKISSIVENQLPEFVREEYPLVSEFLSQYYLSLESQGSPADIIQNIDRYIKVDNLTNLIDSTVLTSDVNSFDTEILVDSTYGFPNSYGLILIDDEIITYTDKTETSFLGCIRGFSGVSSLKNSTKEDELVFEETEAADHIAIISENPVEKTKVTNLSILFLKEFFVKIKKQITPGLENKDFYELLNEKLFLKQSNNLYTSKGTESSFKILFGALYGVVPKIILPRDYLIQPSDAQFRITQDLVVEAVSGNPLELINGTLYQKQDPTGTFTDSRGTITDVKRISRSGKIYYTISLDSGYDKDIDVFGSIKSNFKIHPKTKLTSKIFDNSTYLDVDSTIGFPNSGELVIDLDSDFNGVNDTSIIVTYTSKVLNQFLGCSGVILPNSLKEGGIPAGTEVKINNFAYGTNSDGEQITVRITGVVSGIDSFENNAYYEKGDQISIKTLGEDCKTVKENNWFFNIATNYDIESIGDLNLNENIVKSLKIKLFDNHSFIKGDKIDLFFSSDKPYLGDVTEINNSKEIIVKSNLEQLFKDKESLSQSDAISLASKVRKVISKLNVNSNTATNSDEDTIETYQSYNTNVQNTYVDSENSLYVTSPSLPSYLNTAVNIDDLSYKFSSVILPEKNDTLVINRITTNNENVLNHCYYTGDSVVFKPSSLSSIKIDGVGLTTSVYYVKVINNTSIKLSRSKENIFNEEFVNISGNLQDCRLELFKFNDTSFNSLNLKAQNLIKKISTPKLVDEKKETDPGTIGIFVNGVELLNYKSEDSIFYGPIEKILVSSSGDNYDVVNPPNLVVDDLIGSGCSGYCSVIGDLKRFDIIDPGFDYIEEPSITITGGNGTGARTKVRTITFTHSPEFNAQTVNISNNTIEFFEPHKFRENEKVIYETDGQKSILGLTTNTEYYVSIIDSYSVKLYRTLSDSISKINEIVFNEEGIGIQRLKSPISKKKISAIEIISPGTGYQNKKTKVSGINTSSDILTIKDHNYSSGEVITYYPQSNSIVGLTSSKEYYVTKVSEDEIKLSEIGPISDPQFYYNAGKYINFTQTSNANHYFNYPPITVTINGKVGISSTSGQDYFGKVVPVFRGKIQSVFLESGGVGYGSSDIVNFERQPNIVLSEGSGAQLSPIVKNGSIEKVLIQSPGLNYNSIPDVVINGSGFGAILVPVIINGSIADVNVISGGFGYSQNDTFLSVFNPGQGAQFKSVIKSWRINLFEKYKLKNKIYYDDAVIFRGSSDLQYGHIYPSRSLRSSVYSNNNQNYVIDLQIVGGKEINSTVHSPIIGWAYDGNPIYGPYGFASGNSGPIKLMKSGYELKTNRLNGPRTSLYPLGSFIEDYEFVGNGDLDEYNGRYCITPEFPNGVYAYFSTFFEGTGSGQFLNYKTPKFPYVIGNYYKNKVIDFNFNQSSLIDETYFSNQKLLRNTTPYNLLEDRSGYEFIDEPFKQKGQELEVEFTNSGTVSSIDVISSGNNYKINDAIIFNDNTINGKVSKIVGKNISSITSNSISIENFEFYPYKNSGEFLGISTLPHNFSNNSFITLTTKYEYKKSDNIEVINNTLTLSENISAPNATGIVTTFKVYGNLDFPVKENDLYTIGSEIIQILNIDSVNYEIRVLRSVNSSIGTSHSIGDQLNSLSRKVVFNTGITSDFYNNKVNTEYYFDPSLSVGLGTTSGVGISSTLFLSVNALNTPVTLEKGSQTTIYFQNQTDITKYISGGYIDIIDASNIEYNSTRKRIVSVGNTSIKIDFNTSSPSFPSGSVTAKINKWNILDVPTKSIYLPNHKISTGDELIYNSYIGSPISISTTGSTSFQLTKNSIVYAVKLSNNSIGISTLPVSIDVNGEISGIGKSNSTVYFTGIGTGTYHSFKTNHPNILKGSLSRNISTVFTETSHELDLDDFVYFNAKIGISTTVKLIYDDNSRRFTTSPKRIESVDLINNTLFIPDHRMISGEKLIYNQSNPIGGLQNNGMYYAVIVDANTIGLCDSLYESRQKLPNIINLTTVGIGIGILSPINSKIEVTKYQDIVFDVSDASLSYLKGTSRRSAFDLKLFYDENFNNELGTFSLIKSGSIGVGTTSTITLKTENLPNSFYYSLVPIELKDIPTTKKEIYIDKEQVFYNKISLVDSEISGSKKIVGYTTNTFTFETINPVENSYYDKNNSVINYETNSASASGGISKIRLVNSNKLYNSVPKIKSITSGLGTDAVLDISTESIGNVTSNNITIKDIGFNYSTDITIRPKCIFPSIIRIKPFNILDSILVTTPGVNYISSPDLILLDGLTSEVVSDVVLKYDINSNQVIIVQNTKGINKKEPTIVPINNDNGFIIDDIYYDLPSNTVTVVLDGEYNVSNFPFAVGDQVLIENVNIESDSGKGYNSEFYSYKFFKVETINPTGGTNSSFTYSLDNLLESGELPGEYDDRLFKGTVIPKNYLPNFIVNLKFIEFAKDEIVTSSNNSGVVKGWDPDNNYLKVISNKDFTIGDFLVGQSTNVKALIESIISFDTYLNVDSNSTVNQGWKVETGFLNNNNQRIYDSDYYQYFSYSVESPIDISIWNDVVGSVNHTAGFKKFSDLLIQSEDLSAGISTSQDLGSYYAESISSEFIDLNCVYDFDLVTENSFVTNSKLKSNEIYFDSRILQDYIESIGNRVLLIDDISDKFTTTEPRPFQIIDEFELEDIRYKKYFVYVYDVLDPTRSESLFVSLLHNNVDGGLNQYSVITNKDIVGYFDFKIENNRFGQLVYYPTITEGKIYRYSTFSWGIGDLVSGIGNTSLNIGDISKIEYVNTFIPENSSTPVSLPGISTSKTSYKILITISDTDNFYYQSDEISLLHNNVEVLMNSYGDLRTSSGIVTFSSLIENNQLILKLHPGVGIDTSLSVNAVITTIDGEGDTNGTVKILDNILSSKFISTSMTGDVPENKLIFAHSSDYSTSYSNILIKDTTNNKLESIEINTLLNNSSQESFIVEYGVLNFDNPIGQFTSQINNINGNFELYFTPYEDINYEIKMLSTIIGINNQTGVVNI